MAYKQHQNQQGIDLFIFGLNIKQKIHRQKKTPILSLSQVAIGTHNCLLFLYISKDNSSEIEGCELEGFLKDLYERKHRVRRLIS